MDDLKELGKLFRQERIKRGYRQYEIMGALDLSQASISNIEKGTASEHVAEEAMKKLLRLPAKPPVEKIKYHSEYIRGLQDARRAAARYFNFMNQLVRAAEAGKPIDHMLVQMNNQQHKME